MSAIINRLLLEILIARSEHAAQVGPLDSSGSLSENADRVLKHDLRWKPFSRQSAMGIHEGVDEADE